MSNSARFLVASLLDDEHPEELQETLIHSPASECRSGVVVVWRPLDKYGDIPIMEEVTIKRPEPKPCVFIGSSRKDLKRFPAKVQNRMGHALHQVQEGEEPIAAKALRGFGGRAILELVDDFDSNTYRAVYTVRFAGMVYVLHAFQKKAKKGIATPQQDIELIKSRLRDAEEQYRARTDKGGRKP
jgi:phage-related protein